MFEKTFGSNQGVGEFGMSLFLPLQLSTDENLFKHDLLNFSRVLIFFLADSESLNSYQMSDHENVYLNYMSLSSVCLNYKYFESASLFHLVGAVIYP